MDETDLNRKTAYRMLIIEAITILLFSLFFYALASPVHAYSVALGGMAFVLPNTLFVRLSLGKSGSNSRGMLAWFYIGEAVKIVSTILVFAVSIIMITPLNMGLMFIAYGVVLMINLTGLALSMNK
jgi:F0F1-type ATP synthase assembly protein I